MIIIINGQMMKRYYLYFLALLITLYSVKTTTAQNGNSYRYVDKIVLDAGHGGYDPGARGNKSKEKNIFSLILQD